jgi:hypothetical protein
MNRPIFLTTAALVGIIALGAVLKLLQPANASASQSQLLDAPGIFELTKREKGANEYVERLHQMRANQITGTIEPEWILKAREEDHQLRMRQPRGSLSLQWETMGPNNFGGRTRAILIDHNNPNRMYTGGVTGGLWISNSGGQSWFPYDGDDTLEAIGIASLCQAPNGDIYVGTGEGQISGGGSHRTTTGFLGEGIWKSTDGGNTFQHLSSTRPSGNHNSTVSDWIYVNAIVAHPSDPNILIAGTAHRMYKTVNAGQTWTPIVVSPPVSSLVEDLDIDPDGIVHAALGGQYFKGDINTGTFTKMNNVCGFPSGGATRYIFAIAPSDPNYVYAIGCKSNNETSGVYQSKDKGECWTTISPTGFNPTGQQGFYDMEIAVNPEDKERIYIGGQFSVYEGVAIDNNGNVSWNFYPISNWFTSTSFDDQYIHADHHKIVFHPTNPNIMYVGTDGGVFQTKTARRNYPELPAFTQLNKNYGVTQFYSVAAGLDGSVLGGTQDNGTIYVDFSGNSLLQGRELIGGDGGFADISKWNTKAVFGESQEGTLRRSANKGSGMASFFDQYIDTDQDGVPGGNNETPFYTAFRLWEEYGEDDDNYVYYKSIADEVIQNTTQEFANNDSLIVVGPDTFEVASMRHTFQGEGRVAIGTTGEIWLGTDALDFSQEATWYEIAKSSTGFSSVATCMEWSTDGDILFVGTENGQVFRIDGLRNAHLNYDTLGTDVFDATAAGIATTRIGAFGRFVCDVAVDKNNPDHVVVALGNYNNTNYVYRCTTATTTMVTTDFFAIQGSGATKLPSMPVYSCVIDYYDPGNIIVGTELGIYSSSNSGLTWARESDGMPAAAVFMLRQEMIDSIGKGCYVLYAGSHGRGFWRTTTLTQGSCKTALPTGVTPEPEVVGSFQLYPNPAATYTTLTLGLNEPGNASVTLYDIRGRMVGSLDFGKMSAGSHSKTLPVGHLDVGTYLAVVRVGDTRVTKKFVVAR